MTGVCLCTFRPNSFRDLILTLLALGGLMNPSSRFGLASRFEGQKDGMRGQEQSIPRHNMTVLFSIREYPL